MKYTYPVSMPYLKGNELKYVTEAVESNWITSAGSFVKQFEDLFAKKHAAEYGVSCSSGMTALILACRAVGVEKKDHEVIIPEFTMVASAWAVTVAGGTPVFVDCKQDGLIDTSKIEAAITPHTKAIMPVHIYGRQCNMEEIIRIAKKHNLLVIEDSAESHGVPLSGDIACYSLYGNKIITSGEGGICLTNNASIADALKQLRSMDHSPEHTFLHNILSYNFRMTNLQAAIALAQTEQLEEILKKRAQIEEWYDEELKGLPIVQPKRNVLWMYDIRVQKDVSEALRAYLAERGIETRVFFKPMSQQPMYLNPAYINTVAYILSLEGFYLPTYTGMTKDDVHIICSAIREFYTLKK